jgi:hypothetical protein
MLSQLSYTDWLMPVGGVKYAVCVLVICGLRSRYAYGCQYGNVDD